MGEGLLRRNAPAHAASRANIARRPRPVKIAGTFAVDPLTAPPALRGIEVPPQSALKRGKGLSKTERGRRSRRGPCRPGSAPGSSTALTLQFAALAAVEDLLAEVLQPERGFVGPALRLLLDAGVDDLADEDRVIALLDGADQAALDVSRRVVQDRRAGRAGVEGLAGDGVAVALGRLEERKGHRPLVFAQNVQREGARFLDRRVGVG